MTEYLSRLRPSRNDSGPHVSFEVVICSTFKETRKEKARCSNLLQQTAQEPPRPYLSLDFKLACTPSHLPKSGKKRLCLQEAFDLLENLPPEISDALRNDFSDEEVPANNLLNFSLDSYSDERERGEIKRLDKLKKDTFGDRLISRFEPVNWPPRSCDLAPLDYFLWGYVKSLVYADKPQTLDHLEDNIRRVIADIRPQMLEKIIENWTSRLDYIRASRGSPMPEIIFKM
ncbi:DUF4817 domain-containing protein [Trichonephila clavipes]|nr:DUF4817 domain-containing protein [Trichonephila clavipes]